MLLHNFVLNQSCFIALVSYSDKGKHEVVQEVEEGFQFEAFQSLKESFPSLPEELIRSAIAKSLEGPPDELADRAASLILMGEEGGREGEEIHEELQIEDLRSSEQLRNSKVFIFTVTNLIK